MPEISRFYGIVVKIYLAGKEHNPPHVHVRYGSKTAVLNIHDGMYLQGSLPPTAETMVKDWVKLHKEELEEMWNTQVFHKIQPLE